MFEENYDSEDGIPSEVRHLYKEKDGQFVLIGAGELKTGDDIAKVMEGLRKERVEHSKTKHKLSQFGDLDPDEIHVKLDRIAELEAASGGNIDDDKINTIVETRIKTKTSPLERQIQKLTSERDELTGTVASYQTKETKRTIHDVIRKAAGTAKIRDTAIEDALLVGENIFQVDESGNVVTRDNVGVTPGVDPFVWLSEVKTSRPHWWPESQGAGAKGGDGGVGGKNPFSKDGWNLTEQGSLIKENRARAEQMAKSAGTTVGGQKPS